MVSPRLRAGTLAAIVLVAVAGYALNRIKRDFYDFEVYRTAGIRAVAGEELYRPEDGHYQFKYWPVFALAMAPFGWMSPDAGKIVWYALSFLLLVLFFRRAIATLPARRSTERVLTWWAIVLTAKFVVKELANGQTNVLFGLLIVLAVEAIRESRRAMAGVLIAIATLVKPYALVFVPWLALTQPAIASVAALGTLAAGLLVPAVVYGWNGNWHLVQEWYRTVTDTTAPNLLFPENISFATMWAKWIGSGSTASLLATATGACAVTAALLFRYGRRRLPAPEYTEAAFLLLLIPLLSPQGWDYVLLIALPAIVCLVDRFRESPWRWRVVVGSGFALTSLTIFDLVGRTAYMASMRWSLVTVGAMLLGVALIRLRFHALA